MSARKLIAALAIGLAICPGADAGVLDKFLKLMRGGGKVAVATRQSSIAKELGILSDDALRSMSVLERAELDDAISRFIAHPDGRTIAQKVEELRAITAVDVGSARTIPYSDELPNLWIRVPENPAFDSAARRFASIRMEQSLGGRFDARDIRVVTTALADDAAASAKQFEKFSRVVPEEILDKVGPMGRSKVLRTTDYGEMVRVLSQYKGKTVVVVGHIPSETGAFFIHTKEGIKQIAISEWSRAAREVQVNLVAIGCNSGRIVDFGATGVVNSTHVAELLRGTFSRNPTTVRAFLQSVTGPRLGLVVSPAKAGYFSNEAEIVSRLTRERIGRVVIQEGREGARMLARSELGRPGELSCLERPAVGICAAAVVAHKATHDPQIASQEDDPSSEFADMAQKDGLNHAVSVRRRLFATVVYTVVWLAAAYLIPLGFVACWTANEEEADSLSLVRRPDVRRLTLRLIGLGMTQPISTFRGQWRESFVIAPIVIGPLVYAAHSSFLLLYILSWLGACGLLTAIKIFPTASSNKEEDSLIIPALAFVLWALAGIYLYFEASNEVQMREQMRVSTYLSSQADRTSSQGGDYR